jgi:hypothetical protein
MSAGEGRDSPGSVLFAGQSYYHGWYLSRELRKLGWRADVLNWDETHETDAYYHGEDFRFEYRGRADTLRQLLFYAKAVGRYDIFHFSNTRGLNFGPYLRELFARSGREAAEVKLLKRLGKKIVYSNNGCLDGVSQTSFASWGDRPVCLDCAWRERPDICSDEGNLAWGRLRNSLADYQMLMGGNRIDYNADPRVHEVPQFYCLDPEVWRPNLEIPTERRLDIPESTVKIYHAVGNAQSRTGAKNRNIKSTHVYVPVVERLKSGGHDVELIYFTDIPNRELRYYEAQADIVVDMLTFGFFGGTGREALMLGKPLVCYLREEWLEGMRKEIPGYVDELPVVSATPDTVYDVLKDLIDNPEKRAEIGRRSREFALKWHSAEAAAQRIDGVYRELLADG